MTGHARWLLAADWAVRSHTLDVLVILSHLCRGGVLYCGDREVRGHCSLSLQDPRSPTFSALLYGIAWLHVKEPF